MRIVLASLFFFLATWARAADEAFSCAQSLSDEVVESRNGYYVFSKDRIRYYSNQKGPPIEVSTTQQRHFDMAHIAFMVNDLGWPIVREILNSANPQKAAADAYHAQALKKYAAEKPAAAAGSTVLPTSAEGPAQQEKSYTRALRENQRLKEKAVRFFERVKLFQGLRLPSELVDEMGDRGYLVKDYRAFAQKLYDQGQLAYSGESLKSYQRGLKKKLTHVSIRYKAVKAVFNTASPGSESPQLIDVSLIGDMQVGTCGVDMGKTHANILGDFRALVGAERVPYSSHNFFLKIDVVPNESTGLDRIIVYGPLDAQQEAIVLAEFDAPQRVRQRQIAP